MKKFQSIGTLLSAITLLLVVLLVSVFTYSTEEAYARRADAARLLKTVDVLRHVYLAEDALHNVQGAMSTALAVSTPLPMGVKSLVTRLDRDAESAMAATRDSALLESDGRRNSSWTRIHDARRLYQERYREAMLALDMPRGRRRQNLARDWTASVNHVAATINLRTRQRSMDIADSSAFNNEMTKIIRIAWAIRDTAGHDRRVIADAIVLKHRIDAQELQNFAEQEGNINSPWAVIENDKAELPGFPTRLRPAVDEFAAIYFGHVRTARQQILDALARGARPPLSARQWLGLSDQGLVAISRISTTAFALSRAKVAEALAQADREFDIALALMGLSISLALFTLFYVILRVIKPLRAITVAMQSVASGHLDHPVPFQDRRDEIGQFSRALGLFRDNVIEKRRLEEELRDNQIAKGTAEASSKVKSQFLANMSHELRTPLNA
ncbi:MAG: HAMP domain-containing protein, partial [Rhizomicrobium sp.]